MNRACIFLALLLAACTTDSHLNSASCETSNGGPGDGLPDQTSSSGTSGDHPLAASDPCAPIETEDQTSPPPPQNKPTWRCPWKKGDQSGLWEWGGIGNVTDAESAEKECEHENGAGSDCYDCGSFSAQSVTYMCTCAQWGTVPVFGKQPISDSKTTQAWSAVVAAEACWQHLDIKIRNLGGIPGNRIGATCNGEWIPGADN